MSNAIKRHHPGPVLSRAVEYNGLVFVAGTTADNKGGSCKAQTEEILRQIEGPLAAA
ncbi:MAG: RidA family protein, partial [Betaproteobacteria bacterium]|nr:RidA family protein [Betaproteobacteria bacterium]